MPAVLKTSLLPDPAQTFAQDYVKHEQEESSKGYNEHGVTAMCNRCRWGFVASLGAREYNDQPDLITYCTGPWFRSAERMTNVTNCNGFGEGEFDPDSFINNEAYLSKALAGMEQEDRKDKDDEPDPIASPAATDEDEVKEEEEAKEEKKEEKE